MSLTNRAVTGAAWSIFANTGSRVLGLVGMVLLVRLLVPAEYGMVTASSAIVLIANQVMLINLSMYITSNPKASDQVVFHAHLLQVATGLLAFPIVILVGHYAGPFFGADHADRYVPGLALAALIDRFTYIPDRLLLNQLRFRTSVMSRTAGEVTFTVGSVGLALAGVGPMCIVWANIARSVVRFCIIHWYAPWRRCVRPHPIDMTILKSLVGFGLVVNVGAIAGFSATKIDNLLVSRMFGTEILAYYNLAYNLSEIPSAVVGEQISDVLAVTYAQMGPDRRMAALIRSLGIVGLLVFPLAIGLASTSPTLIAAFLKPEWRLAGTMMIVLASMSLTKPLVAAAFGYLFAERKQARFALLQVLHLAAIVVGVSTVGRLGPLWVCAAVASTYAMQAVAGLWLAASGSESSIGTVLVRMAPPLLACVPMAAAVVAVHWELARLGLDPRISLALEVVAGAITYVGAAFVVARDIARETVQLVRQTIQRRRASSATADAA